MDCKCGIDVRQIGGNVPPVPVIVWCPLHKAAPQLLAACEAALSHIETWEPTLDGDHITDADMQVRAPIVGTLKAALAAARP